MNFMYRKYVLNFNYLLFYIFLQINVNIYLNKLQILIFVLLKWPDILFDLFFFRHNKFLIFIYHIVFSEEFENAEHIIGIMYIYPMIMHLWPTARKLNVSGLIFVNYYFVFLYLLESALKVPFKIEIYPIKRTI